MTLVELVNDEDIQVSLTQEPSRLVELRYTIDGSKYSKAVRSKTFDGLRDEIRSWMDEKMMRRKVFYNVDTDNVELAYTRLTLYVSTTRLVNIPEKFKEIIYQNFDSFVVNSIAERRLKYDL